MCIKNVYNCFSAEIWIIEEIRPNTYLSDGVLGVFSTGSWRVPTIMITVDSSPIIHVYESSWIFVNRARKKEKGTRSKKKGKEVLSHHHSFEYSEKNTARSRNVVCT